jgi:hypothetical protein
MIGISRAEVESVSPAEAGRGGGERALMRAVLEDALQCLAAEVGPPRERPRLAAKARAWVVAADRQWPFSFENICDALGFSVEALRARILECAPSASPEEEEDAGSPFLAPRHPKPSEQDVTRLIREGQPLRVVADRFGISISRASALSGGLTSRMKLERNEDIRQLRRAGWTYRALASRFQRSRIRVMRICALPGDPAETRSADALGAQP